MQATALQYVAPDGLIVHWAVSNVAPNDSSKVQGGDLWDALYVATCSPSSDRHFTAVENCSRLCCSTPLLAAACHVVLLLSVPIHGIKECRASASWPRRHTRERTLCCDTRTHQLDFVAKQQTCFRLTHLPTPHPVLSSTLHLYSHSHISTHQVRGCARCSNSSCVPRLEQNGS
jgi:hypothetical protein